MRSSGMDTLKLSNTDGIATLTLNRGKVNALNGDVVAELDEAFRALAEDDTVTGVVLTGQGPFFSFGFDVPELFELEADEFTGFLLRFSALLTELYLFPKPVVAAVNGHAPAGGCMLTLVADQRVMVEEGATIGLNEASFGASLFAGAVEMLRRLVGDSATDRLILGGALIKPAEALSVGLVDVLVPADGLLAEASGRARALWHGHPETFRSLKCLLRDPVAEFIRRTDGDSVKEFVKIWYSEATRAALRGIQIR